MTGSAYCFGAATIINGIATGKGAAFGIALKTEAEVELTTAPGVFEVKIIGDEEENPMLAQCCVLEVLKKFGLASTHGAKIQTRSEIPISRGLKSSSAAANAIILATFDALGEEYNDLEVINMGIDAALKAKVTLTGAFDDACATYFGNVVVTNNIERKIIKQYSINENYEVLIHVPTKKIKKSEVDTDRLKGIKDAMDAAHELAVKKYYRKAIRINGLTYGTAMGLDTKISTRAIEAGAATAGITGTGPATVILVDPRLKAKVLSAIGSENQIITTVINRTKAGIAAAED
ncbi:shikimate kinase [[Eubacterium] cellulosolvens]